ncbi:Potassium efflux system kefA Protein aefA [Fibrella aestuarina BUZ 2]|uniref:Potassium efflux system kefA Protein aefA n=1 Tax=Fibrella aestuarina BUZ 2 TaxID=1166018 RepID=I0K242_9BACT|nr:mechanosensitive ion channel domain-containing protein [Fibrella aestuarina]CCG98195.1 Potassium efflux system kefA Protein aefA [Fibrella aestuarina BUZ 2]
MKSRLFFACWLLTLLFLSQLPTQAQDTTSILSPESGQQIPDTLLFRIQKAQSIITEVKAAGRRGYGVARIRAGLVEVQANVTPIQDDIKRQDANVDAKSLANYRLILNDAQTKLGAWQTSLSKANNDLQSQLNQLLTLSSDSLLVVAGNDTTEKKLYSDQLVGLKLQLQEAGVRTTAQLDTVSRLLANVSGTSLLVNDLQTTLNEQAQQSVVDVFQQEAPFLWNAPTPTTADESKTLIRSTYQGQQKILTYFLASTWDNRFLLYLLTAGFFVWVFTNYRKARELSIDPDSDTLHPVPVVASLIVLLNLIPLFEPGSPSFYIELTQFLLLLVLTVYLWRRIPKPDLRLWLINGGLYVLLIVTNSLLNGSLWSRVWLIILNLSFLYTGYLYAKHLHFSSVSIRIIRPVTRLYFVLHLLAIVLNLIGRISLAKTFSITAVVALVQITGLVVFIEIVLEALELQIRISACSKGLFSRVNVSHSRAFVKKALILLAVGLWLMVFFINLGIDNDVFRFVGGILSKPRTFGSVTFSLSNILSFSIIIYLSSLLQRNIGLFFGESQLPPTDGQVDQVSSILALIRLVIIVGGVLLAVVASGISIDKFTVVLGALSVGIGLGMQTIVSNFVSGIILIFEKPFRIGDYIELADRKGRILDIGIRSSRMLTGQGSEVIIPNGDLLSNRLVNWSSRGTYLKTEFTLKVGIDTSVDSLRAIIQEEASQLGESMQTPDIMVNSIGGDAIELKVVIWIKSISSEASLKSELLQRLVTRFNDAGIKLL